MPIKKVRRGAFSFFWSEIELVFFCFLDFIFWKKEIPLSTFQ